MSSDKAVEPKMSIRTVEILNSPAYERLKEFHLKVAEQSDGMIPCDTPMVRIRIDNPDIDWLSCPKYAEYVFDVLPDPDSWYDYTRIISYRLEGKEQQWIQMTIHEIPKDGRSVAELIVDLAVQCLHDFWEAAGYPVPHIREYYKPRLTQAQSLTTE